MKKKTRFSHPPCSLLCFFDGELLFPSSRNSEKARSLSMGDSREASPDWLRTFQAPSQSITTLSSDGSEPSGDKSPAKDDSIDCQRDVENRTSNLLEVDGEEEEKICDIAKKSPSKKTAKKRIKVGNVTPAKRKKSEKLEKIGSEDDENVKREEFSDKSMETPVTAPNHSICELSSDSETKSDATIRKIEEKIDNEESAPRSAVKRKSPKKRVKQEDDATEKETNEPAKIEGEVENMDVAEEVKPEKQSEPAVSSSTMPLVLPEKVQRTKALVECEGESIDLSGDMGAVGRVIISETPSKESEMFLDLKGTIYKTIIVPSRTFCVVSIGQSEAKIEAIMNDFIQLKPQSNVYNAETMVEGTLEGFTFESDDEADKMTKDVKGDQSEGAEEKPTKKAKGKAEKKPVATKRKGKDVGGKQAKKRKPQAPKKGKAKK
ncbi:hypothetical protein BVRB_3g050530 isoform A [Beta vulgaris subsp. vulgaris]|uniref:DNA-binding protein BIN4 n=1 Tax=Beta vulgaris subsp. vulgaris TaxID=3555 RepID=A0A0J8FKI5_BETVV|nr:hypothetical protein BVRB_3g050530 isoform A [Beta vulgaris subsp. vulgaris]